MFGQIEVQISLHEEDVDKVGNIIENFASEIDEHIMKGKYFSAWSPEVTHDDKDFLELRISSDRVQNAEWQTSCLIKLLQIHKIRVYKFNSEEIIPQSFICLDEEDFTTYEPNLD